MNLLDLMRAPMIVRPVDPDGSVVKEPQEVHVWRGGWRRVEIELHPYRHLWMWAVSLSFSNGGSGYRVGEKWGRFAESREDALHYALAELDERLARHDDPNIPQIIAWSRALR
ncbi:MAG: hypothetical protein DI527_00490 [Chelatococcus sp.]|nr:MAG: hypothetical protein DI527_00490 [Chelatococcus sp.]